MPFVNAESRKACGSGWPHLDILTVYPGLAGFDEPGTVFYAGGGKYPGLRLLGAIRWRNKKQAIVTPWHDGNWSNKTTIRLGRPPLKHTREAQRSYVLTFTATHIRRPLSSHRRRLGCAAQLCNLASRRR